MLLLAADARCVPGRRGFVCLRFEITNMLWADLQKFDLGPELAKFQLPTLVTDWAI